uniref:NADH-ubiquinone oxidoreductase chain 4L n=1 Tax=Ornithodoros coriaceus TaxID=92741 RepID=A0A3G2KJX1_ORNCO|nr:NADH dehydrogenase subunit 4L [Ornithodoros coriaceus]AYN59507.1 NADH dehydrogenase subunit 4L [Ornithodoros coriaceus]
MLMVGTLVFVVGFLGILMNWKHLLIFLLCLEFMYLGVFFNMLVLMGFSLFFSNLLVFMIFVVCEAGLGLSVLVMGVYFYGNDSINSMSFLKC